MPTAATETAAVFFLMTRLRHRMRAINNRRIFRPFAGEPSHPFVLALNFALLPMVIHLPAAISGSASGRILLRANFLRIEKDVAGSQ